MGVFSWFQQSRFDLDTRNAAKLAGERANAIGGTFEDHGNQTITLSGEALTADDDVGMTRQHFVQLWCRLAVTNIDDDGSYSHFHL